MPAASDSGLCLACGEMRKETRALHCFDAEPLEAVSQAAENLNRFRDAPGGRVRINVLGDAVPLLLEPVMPIFVQHYPSVEVDVSVTNRMVDVIAGGFDAGIRYGGPCRRT